MISTPCPPPTPEYKSTIPFPNYPIPYIQKKPVRGQVMITNFTGAVLFYRVYRGKRCMYYINLIYYWKLGSAVWMICLGLQTSINISQLPIKCLVPTSPILDHISIWLLDAAHPNIIEKMLLFFKIPIFDGFLENINLNVPFYSNTKCCPYFVQQACPFI